MISKLPGWVWFGAWLLAFMGGVVNVVGLLSFGHQPVTHLTGSTSMLATSLATLDGTGIVHYAALIVAFVVGTIISGVVIKDSTLMLGRRYGAALLMESFLLLLAFVLLRRHNVFGLYAAACACGLQNAMASTYSGAVVRTTHLSGMFTDLGIYFGHLLRGLPVDQRRVRLCFAVIGGFMVGGVVGTLCFRLVDYAALLLPAFLCIALSLAYWIYRHGSVSRSLAADKESAVR